MNYDDDIWGQVQAHAWKWEPRTQPVRLVIIHATRSGVAGNKAAQEYSATMNWFTSPKNGVDDRGDPDPDWGGMASVVIGGGKICRVMPEDKYPTYSAGHVDPVGLSIELGQNLDGTPFEERDLDLAARQTAEWCQRYDIPAVMLDYVSGDNREAPGICRHDGTANGESYGKSDPGHAFDNAAFIQRVKAHMSGQDDHDDQDQEEEHMPAIFGHPADHKTYIVLGNRRAHIPSKRVREDFAKAFGISEKPVELDDAGWQLLENLTKQV